MRIYFLKCITHKLHLHKETLEILYIGKDETGNRIYQHTFSLWKKQGLLYNYLKKTKENIDYTWELTDSVTNKKELANWEKKLIKELQPQFNIYLKK